MIRYYLDEASKLGDFDPKYGQRYWCKSTSADKDISFNSLNQDIKAGDWITAEESLNKETKKGVPYYQLRKVKVESGSPVEQTFGVKPQTMTDVSVAAMLTRIEAKIDRLLGEDGSDTTDEPKTAPEPPTPVQEKLDRARQSAQEMQDEMPDDFLL